MKKIRRDSDEYLDFLAWAEETISGLSTSRACCIIWHKESVLDPMSAPAVALQLGTAFMLGKPILLVLPRGVTVPLQLRKLAASVKYFDPDNQTSLDSAVGEALTEAGLRL